MKGKKTGGRVAGTPNKTTIEVKEALEFAFDEIGGKEKFAEWARSKPELFYALWVKLLPKDIKVTGNMSHDINQVAERA